MEAALIRPVLRRLFWLIAEDRGLLPGPPEPASEDLLAAVTALGPDYRDMGAPGLGLAYAALLDGSERKTTGSYYTPPGLVERLLDSALEPVLDRTGDRPAALLSVTVCDPACGAGHFVPYLLPRAAVGNSTPLIRVAPAAAGEVPALLAMLSAFCFDYVVRQKLGGVNLNCFVVRQLPVLPPHAVRPFGAFCADRVLELTYTAYDMAAIARGLGDHGPPFRWDEERRFAIRAELDALFFRLYGIGRADAAYVMDTFTAVRKADVARYGSYRTRDAILDCYDRMDSPARYQTTITPPPGQGPRHQPGPPGGGR